MWEWQLLLAGLQVLLPRYSQRTETEAGGGGTLGKVAGLGTASLGRAGFVPCTHMWSFFSSPVLRPQGDAAWGTHRSHLAPWSSPRTCNLVWVHPLGLPFCQAGSTGC